VNTEQIRMCPRNGFRPFVLHFSDGRQFTLQHPEFILVGRSVLAVLREDDLVETIDPLHVVSLEEISSPSSAA